MGIGPILQVAIDDPSMARMEEFLDLLVAEGVGRIEAGTPLLTTYGLSVIERFAAHIPREKIYADVKCIDLANEQAKPYFDSGIVHFSLHICLEYSQAEQLLSLADTYKAVCYVSTLGLPNTNLLERLHALKSIGYSEFIFHGEGLNLDDALNKAIAKFLVAKEINGIRSTIAGGISEQTLYRIPEKNSLASIIVGRGILRSPKPKDAVRAVLAWLRDDQR